MQTLCETDEFPPKSRVLTGDRPPATIPGMWRESWQRVTVVVVALAVAGCTSGSSATTTTTTAETTSTTAAPLTTTTSITTTTTQDTTTSRQDGETIGSPEVLLELVNEGIAFSALAYGEDIDPSIVPDLTTLDVVAATAAIFEFEAYISTLAPTAGWVDVFALPGSPAYAEYLRSFRSLELAGLRAEIEGEGYEVNEVRLTNGDEVPVLAQTALGEAPDGSFLLEITSSSGPIRFVDLSGNVSSSNNGWSDRSRLVIVAPSDSGWKLYWTEDV